MHIAVKRQRIHRDPQHRQRMTPPRQRLGIGLAQGLEHRRALHHPAVQHHKLQLAVRPALPRLGDEPLDPDSIFLHRIDGNQTR